MDLKTTNIKGKQYVEVNERLKYFRKHFAGYALETELVAVNEATALMRAVVRNSEGRIVATGTAFERKDNAASMVNKTSHVENCETSAWGRALANFGIGIDSSVASADEVEMAIINQEAKPVPQADEAQLRFIADTAAELKMDVHKDIYGKLQITGLPTKAQADLIIKRLNEKKAQAAKEHAELEETVNPKA